jgi:hypothetical protein
MREPRDRRWLSCGPTFLISLKAYWQPYAGQAGEGRPVAERWHVPPTPPPEAAEFPVATETRAPAASSLGGSPSVPGPSGDLAASYLPT